MKRIITQSGVVRRMVSGKRAMTVAAFMAVFVPSIFKPSLAQQAAAVPFKVLYEWKSTSGWVQGSAAISPDGLLVAHLKDGALLLKNMTTGDDKQVVDEKTTGKPLGGHVTFSPDSGRLAFDVGSWGGVPAVFNGNVYSMRTDGSDLVRLAPGNPYEPADECLANPSAQSYKDVYDKYQLQKSTKVVDGFECSVTLLASGAPYTPYGDKLLVDVHTNPGKRHENGGVYESESKRYVGLVPTNAVEHEPERLPVQAAFWSSDGASVYYENQGMLYRYEVQVKQNRPTGINVEGGFVLGKLPGVEAIFFRKDDKPVSILGLHAAGKPGAVTVSADLAKAVASIPLHDSEGRTLMEIQSTKSVKQLLLLYHGDSGAHSPWGDVQQHVQIVSFQ